MEIKNLKQRSKQWHQHRIQYVNASETASIVGFDPFRNQQKLIHDKLFGTTFTANKYTDHGNLMEPIARDFFEAKTQMTFKDTIFIDDEVNLFSASLDGFNHERQIILEIKCPLKINEKVSQTWDQFLQTRIIPKYYWAQIQCQLYCAKAQFAYFLVYFSETEYFVERVYLDHEFINNLMIPKVKTYLKALELTKKELLKTTYLKALAKKNI